MTVTESPSSFEVSTVVRNHGDAEVEAKVSGRIEGIRFDADVILAPHEAQLVEFTPEDYDALTVDAPRKSTGLVHTLCYRSVDIAGNVETTHFAQVRIDTTRPSTTSNADKTTHAGSFTLVFEASDSHSGIASTWYSIDGGFYQAGTSALVAGTGRHTVRFYSEDNAGNTERVNSVAIRMK